MRTPTRSRRTLPQGLRTWLLLAPALGVVLLLFGGGVVMGVLASFGYQPFLPTSTLSLDAYRGLLDDVEVRRSLVLTFRIALLSTVVSVVLAVGAALLLRGTRRGRRAAVLVFQLNLPVPHLVGRCAGRPLGLHHFRGKRVVQLLLLAPVIVPGLAVTLGIQVFFIRYGLSDTRRGVVLVHLLAAVPYVSLVMSSVYANLDLRLEDQARTLGAGPVQVFLRITLPAVAPGLAVAGLFAFLISWGEYVLTLLVGGGAVKTLPLLLYSYLGSTDTPVAAALGLALVVPPVLLLAVTSRLLSGEGTPLAGFGRT